MSVFSTIASSSLLHVASQKYRVFGGGWIHGKYSALELKVGLSIAIIVGRINCGSSDGARSGIWPELLSTVVRALTGEAASRPGSLLRHQILRTRTKHVVLHFAALEIWPDRRT